MLNLLFWEDFSNFEKTRVWQSLHDAVGDWGEVDPRFS